MTSGWIGALLLSLAVASASASPADVAALRRALDDDVPGMLESSRVAGVSIAVIDDGKVVLTAAYGEQSPGVPATIDSLYNVASLTKPVTAEVVLRLASAKRFSLDEPMARYWVDPDIATDPRHELLTPRIALTHRTGFANWRYETGGVLKFIRQPDTAFGYSGEGYEYLANFVERRSGEPFEKLAQDVLFGPARLRHMAYTRRPWFEGKVAVPHVAAGAIEPSFAERRTASDLLYATAGDYARFMVSVMRGEGVSERIAEERVQFASRRTEMCPPAKLAGCPDEIGYGLGWEVMRFGGDTFLMHTGSDEGVFTLAYLDLAARKGAVVLTNDADGPRAILPILERLRIDRRFLDFLRSQAG